MYSIINYNFNRFPQFKMFQKSHYNSNLKYCYIINNSTGGGLYLLKLDSTYKKKKKNVRMHRSDYSIILPALP